jgi:hypothetical protein
MLHQSLPVEAGPDTSLYFGGRLLFHTSPCLADQLFGQQCRAENDHHDARDAAHLLRVITRDLPDFQRLCDERLATLPGVRRLSSTLVIKSIVENRPLPL